MFSAKPKMEVNKLSDTLGRKLNRQEKGAVRWLVRKSTVSDFFKELNDVNKKYAHEMKYRSETYIVGKTDMSLSITSEYKAATKSYNEDVKDLFGRLKSSRWAFIIELGSIAVIATGGMGGIGGTTPEHNDHHQSASRHNTSAFPHS